MKSSSMFGRLLLPALLICGVGLVAVVIAGLTYSVGGVERQARLDARVRAETASRSLATTLRDVAWLHTLPKDVRFLATATGRILVPDSLAWIDQSAGTTMALPDSLSVRSYTQATHRPLFLT